MKNEKNSILTNTEVSMPSENPPTEVEQSIDIERLEASIKDNNTAPLPLTKETLMDATAWNSNKKVTGLWSIDQDKNAFARIAGTGWKKLANNSESGIVALNMLTSHAKAENSNVNYRDEKDGMIHEIYVW